LKEPSAVSDCSETLLVRTLSGLLQENISQQGFHVDEREVLPY